MPSEYALAAVAAAIGVIPLVLAARTFRRGYQPRAESSFGYAVPPVAATGHSAQRFRRMLALQARGRYLGLALGLAAAVVLDLLRVRTDSAAALTDLAGMIVGGAVGSASVALVAAGTVPGGARVARASARRTLDYVHPLDIATAVIAAVASVVAVGIAFTRSATSVDHVWTTGLAGAAVVSLVLFWVACRRILRTPHSSSSLSDLSWEEALRSAVLRELVTVPLIFAVLALWGVALSAPGGAFSGLELTAGCALLLCWFIPLVPHGRYFLRHLWPELAAESEAQKFAEIYRLRAEQAAKGANG